VFNYPRFVLRNTPFAYSQGFGVARQLHGATLAPATRDPLGQSRPGQGPWSWALVGLSNRAHGSEWASPGTGRSPLMMSTVVPVLVFADFPIRGGTWSF
jgi:hypothetical protein